MFLHNLGYKLISLGLAILLWLYESSERNPMGVRQFREPLPARNLAENLVILNRSPEQTTVFLDGPQRTLANLDNDSVDTYVDCTGLGPGEHRVPISYRLDEALRGVLSVRLSDRIARISIDQQTRKTMQVEFQSLTPPAPGYAFGLPVTNPPRAAISGIGKDASRVTHLVAYLEAGTPPASDVQKKVRLIPLDDNGNEVTGIKIEPEQVRLKVPVQELPVTRQVYVSPDLTGTPQLPNRVLAVSVAPDRVTLNGSRDMVGKIGVVETEPIDIANATASFQREVALKPLPGAVTVNRERVRVAVRIGP
ncbi:MAG: hypothetical protein IT210_08540 [Armatimonadetes bacterium]|nr:hypothetical protein [Armatimonadota bacterium]